jgi:hypothetical protein
MKAIRKKRDRDNDMKGRKKEPDDSSNNEEKKNYLTRRLKKYDDSELDIIEIFSDDKDI